MHYKPKLQWVICSNRYDLLYQMNHILQVILTHCRLEVFHHLTIEKIKTAYETEKHGNTVIHHKKQTSQESWRHCIEASGRKSLTKVNFKKPKEKIDKINSFKLKYLFLKMIMHFEESLMDLPRPNLSAAPILEAIFQGWTFSKS